MIEQRTCNLQLIARKDAKMNKLDIASEYMKKGYNCAQSIIKAYANEVGMEEADDTANKDSALI